MDESTVHLYDAKASDLAAEYESADMSDAHRILMRHLPERGRILEIGGGSGRDAAFLLSKGFDITAVDASEKMLAAARQCHPELGNRLAKAAFPLASDSSLLTQRFDAVVLIATIMHIPEQDLFECASQMRDMLSGGGMLILSASIKRDGIAEGRDSDGRLFVERPPAELQLLFERLGFRLVAQYANKDSFARKVSWYTLVMQRADRKTPRSVDEIETIITRDKKDATYKLALLRALCDIAQTEYHMVKWSPDGTVRVPLGLVAEKWLLYYWPIIELDQPHGRVIMPQKRGLEINKPIAFRRAVRDLTAFYSSHGGLSGFFHDYKAGSIPAQGLSLVDNAINVIAQTIVAGPVTYAGGALEADGPYFGFSGHRSAKGKCKGPGATCEWLGHILVPMGTWREMCLIGHWVAESLILRWAELTHQISNRTVPVKDVVDRLLIRPETERDVYFARTIYASLPNLRCTWTDVSLQNRFAVDHTVPFSIWHNNDLWNLLPAAEGVNARKSDKLVTKRLLLRRREPILHYWETLNDAAGDRFGVEVCRTLVRGKCDSTHWQGAAFAGLVEHVETLAIQRGLQRWEP